VTDPDWLADRFEDHRPHLQAVAYRMLGSIAEADDAVQDAWLRASRADVASVDNLGGWLTTVVARLCLDRLRTRRARREEQLGVHLPDPIVSVDDGTDPEHEALLADSVGLALLVVLETLTPAERLAFVLHDTFGLPFDEIGSIVGRTPEAARQLASRARRRVRGAGSTTAASTPAVPRARERELVGAFLAAARAGDFDALLRVLDPDAVARADVGQQTLAVLPTGEIRGARGVATSALAFRHLAPGARRALVNGSPGFVAFVGDRPFAVLGFAFRDDRIAEIDILLDPARLARLDLGGVRA
jgi:RNA polymerase sigma-70 factor (ECF subfamily)